MTKSPDFDIAYRQYVDLLIRCLANTIYKDPPVATWGDREFDREKRATGRDWPSRAHTMVGTARLRNLADLVRRALDERIPGDFIETGVWRAGACMSVGCWRLTATQADAFLWRILSPVYRRPIETSIRMTMA
jgi:Macrocin-O-methyltransferase (TylF)